MSADEQDGTKVYSGGCDGAVKCFDLATGQATTLHTHDKPVKCVAFVNTGGQQILVSAGWDKQLRVSKSRSRTAIRESR
jgi:mRNA export factor